MDVKKNLHKALLKLYRQYLNNNIINPNKGICINVNDIMIKEMNISLFDANKVMSYMMDTLFLNYPDRAKSSYGTYYRSYVVDGPEEPEETYWQNPKRIKLLKWLIKQTKE